MRTFRLSSAAALIVSAILAGCAGDGSPAPVRPPVSAPGKVLLIGLDGADWEIIDRLAGEGRLPHLSRMRREGASGVLLSEEPLLSPIVWTTIATGRGPLDHEIFGFLTERDGVTQPIGSDARRVRAFWNVASEFGLRVGVIGWYATWPAEPVHGFVVSDRVGVHQVPGEATATSAGLVSPPELELEIERLREDVARRIGPETAARFFTAAGSSAGANVSIEQERIDTFVNVLRTTELYRALVPRLLERFDPQLCAVYFEGTDSVGHLFAAEADPPLPGVDPAVARHLAPAFDRFYEYTDTILGEILERVDPRETTVMIVSDHGFKSGERRLSVASRQHGARHAPLWHRPEGVVLLWGRGVRAGVEMPPSSIYDVTPTMFRLLGVPLAETLVGRPMEQGLLTEAMPEAPATLADYEAIGERPATPVFEDAPADEALARLRALGYVGGADRGSEGAAGDAGEDVALNRYNRGIVLIRAGRWDEAVEEFRALQRDQPGLPLGYLGEGMAQLERGEPAAAVAPLEAARRHAPELVTALTALGEAYLRSGRAGEARAVLEESLRREPNQGRASRLLGEILVASRQASRAASLFERARRLAGSDLEAADASVGLAVVAEEAGRFDDAEAEYRRALDRVADHPRALERYANLQLYRERPEAAAELLARLVRRVPGNAGVLNLYARALHAAGREGDARAVLERSLQVDPDQPAVRAELGKSDSPPS